jgi:hypothetical protein
MHKNAMLLHRETDLKVSKKVFKRRCLYRAITHTFIGKVKHEHKKKREIEKRNAQNEHNAKKQKHKIN